MTNPYIKPYHHSYSGNPYLAYPWRPHRTHFYSSVYNDAPLPEIRSKWNRVGILTQNNRILNLYARPISVFYDRHYEYSVEDKNSFFIPLGSKYTYLEDGDSIGDIPGKSGLWKVNLFSDSKYVWV